MTKSTSPSGVVAFEVKYLDGSKETTVDIANDGKVLSRRIRAVDAATPSSPNDMTKPNDTTKPNEPSKPDSRR